MIGTNKRTKIISASQGGYALIEMIIAVGLFAVTIVAAAGIFQSVIDGQRSAKAAQNIQESTRYALEVMSKEIRNAQKSDATHCESTVGDGNLYNTGGGNTILYFRNKHDQCVTYYLSGNRIFITRDAENLPITPAGVFISQLKFIVRQDLPSQPPTIQPTVTMLISGYVEGKAMHKEEIKLQSTISSRFYQ